MSYRRITAADHPDGQVADAVSAAALGSFDLSYVVERGVETVRAPRDVQIGFGARWRTWAPTGHGGERHDPRRSRHSSDANSSSHSLCMAIIATSIGRIRQLMSFLILFVSDVSAHLGAASSAAGYIDLRWLTASRPMLRAISSKRRRARFSGLSSAARSRPDVGTARSLPTSFSFCV